MTANLIAKASGLFLVGAAAAITATTSITSQDTSEFILLVSLVSAYLGSRRATPVLRVYVIFVALWFLLPSIDGLDTGQPQLARVWLIAALWLFAWTGGQLLFGRFDRLAPDVEQARHLHDGGAVFGLIVIGLIAMAIQAHQIAEGISGYTLQISGVSNTSLSGGIAGMAGPALIAAIIIARWSSTRRIQVTLVVLLVIEALFLTQSGIKAAAITYFLTLLLAYIAVRPPSNARERGMLLRALMAIIVLGVPLTIMAGAVRQADEVNAGYESGRTALTLVSLPRTALTRFDEVPNLGQALGPLNPQARSVVSMTHQVESFVPRELWPEKPVFNYGEQVSSVIFGLPASYRTSSTITWLGDLYLNGGLWTILFTGVVLGSVVRRTFRRAVRAGPMMTILTVLLVSALFNPENPIVLAIAGMLRAFLVLGLACLMARLVRPLLPGGRRLSTVSQVREGERP